ncbi:MAG: DUF433 domain-containing protein [Promethearchaeota archaeon]|nr:MAG: DUF433 domain-containing protein [Candidatus Lokiarchaeota archaeon]
MNIPERIVIDEKLCAGKPCIKGTRLSVDLVLELLASGWNFKQIQEEYEIEKEDILAVLKYASNVVSQEEIFRIST